MNSFAESAFRRHYRTIHGFLLRRVHDRDLADDLAQEVFVDALSTLESARPQPGSALAWLYTIARRRLSDEFRRSGRDESLLAKLWPAGREEAAQYGSEFASVLREATAWLPPEQRDVLVRHLLRGQTFPELARELGVSEAALKMRYVRALRELRDYLEQKGFTP